MIVVLDASAGIEVILNRSAALSFKKQILNAKKVITSELYKAEVANVMWKYVSVGRLTADSAHDLMHLAYGLVDEYVDTSDLCDESLEQSIRLKHSVYDLLYLTVARRNAAFLLTMDKKLKNLARKEGIECV